MGQYVDHAALPGATVQEMNAVCGNTTRSHLIPGQIRASGGIGHEWWTFSATGLSGSGVEAEAEADSVDGDAMRSIEQDGPGRTPE
ncbi:hypothetical protein [Streptomyces sp. NPDC087538]|uniref:hypothetical protein n=1 Tax=Streptomyces sp. NPDC087538 TaxID=3365797 RepID=UPI00381E9A7D